MFKKICIKSKELANQKIDIAFLVDTMLFYGNVVVLAHKEELITLLKFFGEDFLKELIKSSRLDLIVRENILGSMAFPGDKYNIDLFSKKDESYSAIIYEAHRELVERPWLSRDSLASTDLEANSSNTSSVLACSISRSLLVLQDLLALHDDVAGGRH